MGQGHPDDRWRGMEGRALGASGRHGGSILRGGRDGDSPRSDGHDGGSSGEGDQRREFVK
jgi:hypothetical protein